MVSSCTDARICPYYLTKERLHSAELVLAPYNYIISPFIRNALEIKLGGAGVIIDEGHNIESACRWNPLCYFYCLMRLLVLKGHDEF